MMVGGSPTTRRDVFAGREVGVGCVQYQGQLVACRLLFVSALAICSGADMTPNVVQPEKGRFLHT